MATIFISYAHTDTQFAERLTHNLKRRGHSVWIDRSSIRGGNDWIKAIEEGIISAELFLVCCSEAAVNSEWVGKEIDLALSTNKAVFPLRIEAVNLPESIEHLQWIDFVDRTFEKSFDALIDLLPPGEDPQTTEVHTNPYTSRTMIKDASMFFGRRDELHDLYNHVAASQSCSIVGPRRMGKSSLLYNLTQPASYSKHLPDPFPFVLAYLDLQELTGLGPDDFFSTALERLARAGNGKFEVDLQRDATPPGFRRFLSRTTDAGLNLVLCVDEFEVLSQNPNFAEDFFTYLRGLCSNYSLALVTASRASLYDLCHKGNLQTSQFWNIFVERNLELMPVEEAREIIVQPFSATRWGITEADVAHILELAGCHPFFIQIACYHVFEDRLNGKDVDHDALERQFFDEAQRYYGYAWKQLDEDQRSTLVALLRHAPQAMEPKMFQTMKHDAFLKGNAKHPQFASSGWRQFIEEQPEAKTSPGRPVPATRNVPQNLKKSVQDTLPTIHSENGEPLPEIIGRYEVKSELGRGGMATVLRAHDPRFKRDVAIKVLPKEFLHDPGFRTRFEREAQIIAGLEHPAIVPVYDFGEQDSQPYLVMRLMTGGSLANRIKRGAFGVPESAHIISRIASALDEVHGHGIVHRDLKPGNIMFDQHGDAFLADFGIARIMQSETGQTGGITGTPAYMSPEQVYGDQALDGRSDIYALGIILFEMLTGQAPFQATTPSKAMMMRILEPTPRITDNNPDLPGELEAIIAHSMAKDPNERYAQAGDMALELASILRS